MEMEYEWGCGYALALNEEVWMDVVLALAAISSSGWIGFTHGSQDLDGLHILFRQCSEAELSGLEQLCKHP